MGCVAINTNLRNNEMTLREKIEVMEAVEHIKHHISERKKKKDGKF